MPSRPDEDTAPKPVAVQALPLNLPPSAPPGSAPQTGGMPLPTTAPAVASPAASSSLRVGSEGYGPHIERALAGNDAAAAWEAVRWLRRCASNEQRRTSLEVARAQGIAPEVLTQMMQEADEEARRCQTITDKHHAMLPELASRAMRAGVPEAASAYAAAVFSEDLTPAQRREVADAMRRDALAGHPTSLLNAVLSNEAWGLSDAERLGFLYAYGELADEPGAKATLKALAEQRAIRFKTAPTPEQLAAAKLAGQQILDRVRAGKQP